MQIHPKKIKESNFYFPVTILKQFGYFLSIMGIKIKGLCKSVLVTKRKIFKSYDKWSFEDWCFYFKSVYINLTFSANKRISINNKQKLVKNR